MNRYLQMERQATEFRTFADKVESELKLELSSEKKVSIERFFEAESLRTKLHEQTERHEATTQA